MVQFSVLLYPLFPLLVALLPEAGVWAISTARDPSRPKKWRKVPDALQVQRILEKTQALSESILLSRSIPEMMRLSAHMTVPSASGRNRRTANVSAGSTGGAHASSPHRALFRQESHEASLLGIDAGPTPAAPAASPPPPPAPAPAPAPAHAAGSSHGGAGAENQVPGNSTDPVSACAGIADNASCGRNAQNSSGDPVEGKCKTVDDGNMRASVCMSVDYFACDSKTIGDACYLENSCGAETAPCEGVCAAVPGPFQHICVRSVNGKPVDISTSTTVCQSKAEGADCGNNADLDGREVPGKCKNIWLANAGAKTHMCVPKDFFVCDGKPLGSLCKMELACPPDSSAGCSGMCSMGDLGSPFERVCYILEPAPGNSDPMVSICSNKQEGFDCGRNADFDGKKVPGQCKALRTAGSTTHMCLPKDLFSCNEMDEGAACTMDSMCPPTSQAPCSGHCVKTEPDAPFELACSIMSGSPVHRPRFVAVVFLFAVLALMTSA
eukprot:TRINITY_DN5074_c0_g2_i1.p1 TRINITY_DN5074_c0_g2~~TRINITY_DN5074_c0_g2_i1.p1  ORF type:complete len:496 (+),score=37.91 TRINITY_DN5074_c0_g2_i1:248-1735(+)